MNFMKNFIFLKLFYCFLILFVNSISNKLLADWPQFRGPTGDGRVNVISHPKKWSTKENLAWSQAIAGGGVVLPYYTGQKSIFDNCNRFKEYQATWACRRCQKYARQETH